MCGFCNMWVFVCVGFVIFGCFGNCAGVLVMCVLTGIYCVLYCLYCILFCFIYVYLFLFVTGVRTTATE